MGIPGGYEESGDWSIGSVSDELRAVRHMFRRIGNMLCTENANRFIHCIEAAYIKPVDKAQST
uniref:hypothetical protein n=1 Tax=Streptomyces sp. F8 TaxID=1436085 RepID=UPI0015E83B1B|nr:hypothetical protein [Streptomyces sp. F8]